MSSWPDLREDHRADSFVGEYLEQQDVGDASVEDVGATDTVAHRVHARADLRDHPAGQRAVAISASSSAAVIWRMSVAGSLRVTAKALDVGEVHELLGAERLGHRARDHIRIDVVRLPIGA